MNELGNNSVLSLGV